MTRVACVVALAGVFWLVSGGSAVAGGPGSDLKAAVGSRVAGPSVASHAPAVYRCTLTAARSWSRGEVITTTRYSGHACGPEEFQTTPDLVESVVQHYKSDASLRSGGSVPNASPVTSGVVR